MMIRKCGENVRDLLHVLRGKRMIYYIMVWLDLFNQFNRLKTNKDKYCYEIYLNFD